MATQKLRKELQNFRLNEDERPFVISPDLIRLFFDLGERGGGAIILALIVQRIARMGIKTKPLNLEQQDYFDLFPFIDPRYLRKCIYKLRKYGIWRNKKYNQKSVMASYTDIRISWPTIARLAKKTQERKQKNEVKMLCRKLNKEGGMKC
jgi:hypothetical protein